ncbi:cytochrome C [Duganella sp. BJB488]|nr:cytochrome C [Duganella sp. BJB489]RFP11859.1 cytochrome C [Duganella sp. BJB488]RFP29013.1 cytochrome C [Duganella sp. BJB480]
MRCSRRYTWRTLLAIILALSSISARAVPSFARQTQLDCFACHVSWPELTPTGRQFKLNGYTLGPRLTFPVAGMVQLSYSETRTTGPDFAQSFPKDRNAVLQAASVFFSGKLSDHMGIFSQFTYDGVEHRTSIDNVDLRYANHVDIGKHDLLYGFTLHNNPQVQDVYNTVSAWGFPFASSPTANAPAASPLVSNLGQQVAGMGADIVWRNTLYAELTAYHTSNRLFSPLRLGVPRDTAAALDGYNPYWRLALQHEWDGGKHSAMVGTYGLVADVFPDNKVLTGPTDHFRDIGVDAQYQYITDRHRLTGQVNFVRESATWNAGAQTSNSRDKLYEFRAKATYYFEKKYGINLSRFDIHGSVDSGLYNTGDSITGSASGSPDSSGCIVEFNYLPRRDIRLMLQFTHYDKFNGAKRNYDGFGRAATANDTIYLLGWFMF